MTKRQRIIALLIILGMVLAGWWFLSNFKMEEVEIPLPPGGEAKYNRLYAAENYLQTLDIEVDSITLPRLLQALPKNNSVILIDSNRVNSKTDLSTTLLNWVNKGGHLILHPGFRPNADDTLALQDDLLSTLNISVNPVASDISDQSLQLKLSADQSEQNLSLEYFSYTHLSGATANDFVARKQNHTHLIQRAFGQGMVTVISNMNFLSNNQIRHQDNALSLWYLVQQHHLPEKVWLVYNEKAEGLAFILWRKFKLVIAILTLLGVLWLVRSMQRFGPLEIEEQPASRSILEHIDASGMHYWRNGQADKLLQRSRESVNAKISKYHPAWRSLERDEREAFLAKTSNWPKKKIQEILHTETPKDKEQFTYLIQQIELLEKTI